MTKKKVIKQSSPYKVEKGIKMERKKHCFARFPFDKMNIGDSFFVPASDQEPHKVQSSIYSAVVSYNKTHSTKIQMRSRREEGGTRVWRIQDRNK